ncbi:hypothetical protein C499_14120 [Halogeometricum borinquense DSM 11551]|nr:hypothetical protein C499_14120 [Halogeometricum borinquense DSM 11551]
MNPLRDEIVHIKGRTRLKHDFRVKLSVAQHPPDGHALTSALKLKPEIGEYSTAICSFTGVLAEFKRCDKYVGQSAATLFHQFALFIHNQQC